VTRRVRAGECGERVRRIPIVALTALALSEEKERILAGGVDHYLAKPVGLGSLKRMLQTVHYEVRGGGD
jgi:CheY-like chemotaxis protein